jgi:hypothetical protein
MEKSRKKDLVRAYKERKQVFGVYAVHCDAENKIWVAGARSLDQQENRTWFMLRQGGHPNKEMTAAWRSRGEAEFRFEILEEVSDENPLLIDSLLKERAAFWQKELNALPVIG